MQETSSLHPPLLNNAERENLSNSCLVSGRHSTCQAVKELDVQLSIQDEAADKKALLLLKQLEKARNNKAALRKTRNELAAAMAASVARVSGANPVTDRPVQGEKILKHIFSSQQWDENCVDETGFCELQTHVPRLLFLR